MGMMPMETCFSSSATEPSRYAAAVACVINAGQRWPCMACRDRLFRSSVTTMASLSGSVALRKGGPLRPAGHPRRRRAFP